MIRSLKCHFWKLVLLWMIECIDKKEIYNGNLLDAFRFIHKAWEQVNRKRNLNSGQANISTSGKLVPERKSECCQCKRQCTKKFPEDIDKIFLTVLITWKIRIYRMHICLVWYQCSLLQDMYNIYCYLIILLLETYKWKCVLYIV